MERKALPRPVGRPPVHLEPLRQRSFHLSDEDFEFLRAVGGGNGAAGLRELIRAERARRTGV